MLKLFLAMPTLMALVSAIHWNDNMCQLYVDQGTYLMLKDSKKGTLDIIDNLPHSSYMKFEEAVEIYYFHNNFKAMNIELLSPTETDNCPYKISLGRNLAASCSYTDCNECMMDSSCEWSGSSTSPCIPAAGYQKWYDKIPLCTTRYNYPKSLYCPKVIYDSYLDSSSVSFPEYGSIPANTFCKVVFNNPNKSKLDVRVTKYFVI